MCSFFEEGTLKKRKKKDLGKRKRDAKKWIQKKFISKNYCRKKSIMYLLKIIMPKKLPANSQHTIWISIRYRSNLFFSRILRYLYYVLPLFCGDTFISPFFFIYSHISRTKLIVWSLSESENLSKLPRKIRRKKIALKILPINPNKKTWSDFILSRIRFLIFNCYFALYAI